MRKFSRNSLSFHKSEGITDSIAALFWSAIDSSTFFYTSLLNISEMSAPSSSIFSMDSYDGLLLPYL